VTALAALGLTPEQHAERAEWLLDLFDLRVAWELVRGAGK